MQRILNVEGLLDPTRDALERAFDTAGVDLLNYESAQESDKWVLEGTVEAFELAKELISKATAELAGVWKELKDPLAEEDEKE